MSGVLGLLACTSAGRAGGVQAPEVAPGTVQAEGEVQVIGAEPLAQIVVRDSAGRQTTVVGLHRQTLAGLVGLTVRVRGSRSSAAPPATAAIEVTEYEIVGLRGEPVHVGTLERAGDQWRLGGKEGWALTDVPPDLQARLGATVWVSGPMTGGRIAVRIFGVVRLPEAK
jgi:hypothetical protein